MGYESLLIVGIPSKTTWGDRSTYYVQIVAIIDMSNMGSTFYKEVVKPAQKKQGDERRYFTYTPIWAGVSVWDKTKDRKLEPDEIDQLDFEFDQNEVELDRYDDPLLELDIEVVAKWIYNDARTNEYRRLHNASVILNSFILNRDQYEDLVLLHYGY